MEVMRYYNHPEVMEWEKRHRTCFTVAKSLKSYLKYLLEALDVEDYNMSYLIEDIIYLVVSDEQLLKRFIEENIVFTEPEEIKIILPPEEKRKKIDELAEQLKEEGEEP